MRRIMALVAVALTFGCAARAADDPAKDTLAGRAKAVNEALETRVKAGQPLTVEFVDQLGQWSKRLGQAEADAAADAAGKRKAWQDHLLRMNALLKMLDARQRNEVTSLQMSMGEYYVREAELLAGVAAAPAAAAAMKAAAEGAITAMDSRVKAGQALTVDFLTAQYAIWRRLAEAETMLAKDANGRRAAWKRLANRLAAEEAMIRGIRDGNPDLWLAMVQYHRMEAEAKAAE